MDFRSPSFPPLHHHHHNNEKYSNSKAKEYLSLQMKTSSAEISKCRRRLGMWILAHFLFFLGMHVKVCFNFTKLYGLHSGDKTTRNKETKELSTMGLDDENGCQCEDDTPLFLRSFCYCCLKASLKRREGDGGKMDFPSIPS